MANTPLMLSLSAGVSEERLAQLTRDLGRDLSRAGVQARPVEAPSLAGDRGEPVTLGVLALALISHGAITSMIDCFKAYLARERTLTIKLTCQDGTQIEVAARNLNTAVIREALEAVASARSG